jgi:hypothetical protein
MLKIYIKEDIESKLNYVYKYQGIDRSNIDNVDIDGQRPKRPDILYIPYDKLPSNFFLHYKRYIADDNNNIILGPKFYEQYPEQTIQIMEQSVLTSLQQSIGMNV